MIKKVAFTMYPVQDWKRARAFYGETLGLKIGSKDMKPSEDAGASVAVEVDDLDKLNAELKAKRVRYKADMIHSPVCRMSVILDSEGNSIILHELKKR